MRDQNKWDIRYLGLAEYISKWSRDPSTKVGAVVVDKYNAVIGLGYNGFAPGVEDTDERLNNRELKYKLVVHGEINAMNFAQRDLHGCTLYTWPFMPCSVCAAQIISRGIVRVVAPYSDNPRWKDSFELTRMEFGETGVELVEVHIPSNDSKEEMENWIKEEKSSVVHENRNINQPKPIDPLEGFDLSTPKDIM